MLDTLLTAASGGAFGVFGGLVKKGLDLWQDHKQAQTQLEVLKENNKHEQIMQDKQKEYILEEAKNALALAELNKSKESEISWTQGVANLAQYDRATFATGNAAKDSKWFVFVDCVRGLIRPGLTVYLDILLTVLTAWITYEIVRLYPQAVQDPEFLKNTFYRLIDAVIFLSTTATSFWFLARPSK